MNVFELYAKIALDTGDYEKGLEDASGKTSSFAGKLKTGLANAAKVATVGIGAVTTATTALYAGVTAAAGQVASYGDNIDKMSQKMGMSAEAYQEWDAVMQHSGTSIESLQSGMKTLANAVESGNDAFERLGISQEQIAKMSNEELFSATITALQNVGNETERTYLAGQLLGRGATELGALLNTSAEDTQAMKDRVHELGGVMSDDAIKAAARYQDSLQDMQTSFSGLKNNLIADFLPGMATIMDGIGSMMTGEDGAQALLSDGITQMIETMDGAIPNFFNAAGQIIGAVSEAITDNLPSMVDGGLEMLMSIVDGIIENLPLLVESAAEIIVTFANGIAERLPQLIPTIVDVVIQIVETLIDNVDMLVDAALEIILALTDGLIESLPKLIEEIPGLVIKIVDAIIENAPKLLESAAEIIAKLTSGLIEGFGEIAIKVGGWLYDNIVQPIIDKVSDFKDAGKQLLEGLWNGISDKVAWLREKVSGVVDTIKGWFTGKDGFDEHSPSKWSKQVFRYVMEGGGEGLDAGLPGLMQSVGSVTDRVKSGLDFGTASVDFASSGPGSMSKSIPGGIANSNSSGDIVLNITSEIDGAVLSHKMYRYNIREGKNRGSSLVNV